VGRNHCAGIRDFQRRCRRGAGDRFWLLSRGGCPRPRRRQLPRQSSGVHRSHVWMPRHKADGAKGCCLRLQGPPQFKAEVLAHPLQGGEQGGIEGRERRSEVTRPGATSCSIQSCAEAIHIQGRLAHQWRRAPRKDRRAAAVTAAVAASALLGAPGSSRTPGRWRAACRRLAPARASRSSTRTNLGDESRRPCAPTTVCRHWSSSSTRRSALCNVARPPSGAGQRSTGSNSATGVNHARCGPPGPSPPDEGSWLGASSAG